ncbi:hypothetical protein ACOMICROBIO_EPCKBFOG_02596 [Vibrio sp. B1FLJ16]|nr:hypothetical protein ACOMICROBIO_EPCKBFOG_02596 [Vibrio sp. B1FLJ16]CAE6920166.1 hypothetical protein ACOMICROBIO_EPCKBFOG_02596 [Vibrio sp. B1FLJ16]
MRPNSPWKDSIRDSLPAIAKGFLATIAGKIFELLI